MEDFTMKSLQLVVATIIATTVFPAFGMNSLVNKLTKQGKKELLRIQLTEQIASNRMLYGNLFGINKLKIQERTSYDVPRTPMTRRLINQWNQFDMAKFLKNNSVIANMKATFKNMKATFNTPFPAVAVQHNLKKAVVDAKEKLANIENAAYTIIPNVKSSFANLQDAAKQALAIDRAAYKARIAKINALLHKDDKAVFTNLSRFFFGPSKQN